MSEIASATEKLIRSHVILRWSICKGPNGSGRRSAWCDTHNCYWRAGAEFCGELLDRLDDAEAIVEDIPVLKGLLEEAGELKRERRYGVPMPENSKIAWFEDPGAEAAAMSFARGVRYIGELVVQERLVGEWKKVTG